jgi:hypothetical protein
MNFTPGLKLFLLFFVLREKNARKTSVIAINQNTHRSYTASDQRGPRQGVS